MTLNALLEPLSIPLSEALGLPRLPSHFSTALVSFLGYQFMQWTSPLVFNRLFPEHYGKASKHQQQGWAVKACSMVNALVVVPLAFQCLYLKELEEDKVWGTHPLEGELEAVALGFLWDAIEETFVHFQSIGFALHGIATLSGLLLTFRPLFGYLSVRFLLLELSTPFVNINWFLKQTGHTDSTLNVINGACLLVTFFLARICFGTIVAYRLMWTVYETRQRVPRIISLAYVVGTTALQLLNWYWMYKILYLFKKGFARRKKAKEL